MRLLIYEWCCSGGLAGPDRELVLHPDDDVNSLAREGRAMFLSLVADAARDGGFDVTALVDESLLLGLPAAARRVVVPRGRDVDMLVAAAGLSDAAIVVAPETAGVLATRVESVRAVGGTVLGPSSAVIRRATDKQATMDALAAAGVPVPAGRSLAAGEEWPIGFHQPAVRKARASTGCDGLVVVRPGDRLPCPALVATRLEAECAGQPVGVSCLIGPNGVVPVAALVQRFSSGPIRGYVGGTPLHDVGGQRRAERLAVRTVEALLRSDPAATHAGWVGVDMILGSRPDGLDDRVLEVNPRVTTSFVGLAAAAPVSLVRTIVDVAIGREIGRGALPTGCTFTLTDDAPACST
ncbi:MAG: ATP-grasp domain-containing protein [Planctomycetes bacterium]|nr:ATP-grasp domain-containing protein [Planctomycetota bacterium]